MNILVLIFVIILILFLLKKNNKEDFKNLSDDKIEYKSNISNEDCIANIERYKLIKKDLENLIYEYKTCSIKDNEFKKINPFSNDCNSSPYNNRWNTNILVQKCALDIEKKIKKLKNKYKLTDEEFNIIKRWKKLKCLNNLPLKFSEVECAKKYNCENKCKFKKYKCQEIIKELKKFINVYKYCSFLENDDCNSSPSKFKNNDNVKKNKLIQKCKIKIKNWLDEKYIYWDLDKNDRIKNYLDKWENVKCPIKFINDLQNQCNLLTRCK